jgi:hypothetical protein
MTPKEAVDNWIADGFVAEAQRLNPNKPGDCAGLALVVMRRLRQSGLPSAPGSNAFQEALRTAAARLQATGDASLGALAHNTVTLLAV